VRGWGAGGSRRSGPVGGAGSGSSSSLLPRVRRSVRAQALGQTGRNRGPTAGAGAAAGLRTDAVADRRADADAEPDRRGRGPASRRRRGAGPTRSRTGAPTPTRSRTDAVADRRADADAEPDRRGRGPASRRRRCAGCRRDSGASRFGGRRRLGRHRGHHRPRANSAAGVRANAVADRPRPRREGDRAPRVFGARRRRPALTSPSLPLRPRAHCRPRALRPLRRRVATWLGMRPADRMDSTTRSWNKRGRGPAGPCRRGSGGRRSSGGQRRPGRRMRPPQPAGQRRRRRGGPTPPQACGPTPSRTGRVRDGVADRPGPRRGGDRAPHALRWLMSASAELAIGCR
jgi:hypothetical protein